MLNYIRRNICVIIGLLYVCLRYFSYICREDESLSKSLQDVEEIYRSIAEDRDRYFGAVAACRFVARPHETRFCRSCFYAMQFRGYLRSASCKTEKRLIYNLKLSAIYEFLTKEIKSLTVISFAITSSHSYSRLVWFFIFR